jgi:crossover junction endodeoxyribonuclease RusA
VSWTLTHEAKAWTMNDARGSSNRWKEAGRTKEWRGVFWLLAIEAKVPSLPSIVVTVLHETRTARLPDCGACAPAVKAAIDGLVDAGVIADDTPEFLRCIRFVAPFKTGRDALSLVIDDATEFDIIHVVPGRNL